jgi:hypothetical protein
MVLTLAVLCGKEISFLEDQSANRRCGNSVLLRVIERKMGAPNHTDSKSRTYALPTIRLTVPRILSAITALGTIVSITAGVTWAVLHSEIDDLHDRLEAFQQSKDWQLPSTLQALNQASVRFILTANERQQYTSLVVENPKLKGQIAVLGKQNSDLQQKNAALDAQVKSFVKKSVSYSLQRGQSGDLIANTVKFGVGDIDNISNSVEIYLGERICKLYPSQSASMEYSGLHCSVTLVAINEASKSANFATTCQ